MPRLSNKQLRKQHNKAMHQRRRTTRGHRKISKFKKYKYYYIGKEVINEKSNLDVFIINP